MRRLIVHLGVQKTGSTAIQRFLRQNADALAPLLIVRTPEEGTPMRPLGRAAVTYSLRPSSDSAKALQIALEDALQTLPDNDLPVLLSHENLAGAMPGNGGETRLYPALPDIAALIAKTASGMTVDFVVYSRNMKIWKESVWAQAVRTDGYPRKQVAFMSEIADMPGWGDLLSRLSNAVGSDRVTRFKLEDETCPRHPGRQLLRHAGLSDGQIDALSPLEGASMQRLSASSTEFLRRLNGLSLNPHARGKVAELVARTQPLFAADRPHDRTP
ncbi:hypothetical protein [Paracoccus sp. (in: a-proteobacteria)]|uniref:hypothetical protein n=1 Tax=Paracoccus sp. TaxID=267 RepID=UPI003A899E87